MKYFTVKKIILVFVLVVAVATPVLAADKGATISGGSSISGTQVSKSAGSKVGPEAGNIDNDDTPKKPKTIVILKEAAPVAATKPTTDANPYGSAPSKAPVNGATINSDGNAVGSVSATSGAAIDSDGNAVVPETEGADTNKDGVVTNSELNNAANGGDIHSTHR